MLFISMNLFSHMTYYAKLYWYYDRHIVNIFHTALLHLIYKSCQELFRRDV